MTAARKLDLDLLLDTKQVAAILRCSPDNVRRLIADEKLEPDGRGARGIALFQPSTVEAYQAKVREADPLVRAIREVAARTCGVYLVRCTVTRRVKIGHSKNEAWRRVADLQTGSPTALELLGALGGTVDLERELHERFAEKRLHGEWFALTDADVRSLGIDPTRQP